ncbi:MAG: hypothetical protein JWR69_2554 [Pedosphaera sp.]|nr:hypothetical protein [Pedosphaera sp.]
MPPSKHAAKPLSGPPVAIGGWLTFDHLSQDNHNMKTVTASTLILAAALVLAGCSTSNNKVQKPERGPEGTIAYNVEIESSDPGARVEANNEAVGKAPMTLKIFGDRDGTFHNFGSYHYTIIAYPVRSGQQPQTKDFHTGGWFTPEDRVPKKLFFDFGPVPELPKPEVK